MNLRNLSGIGLAVVLVAAACGGGTTSTGTPGGGATATPGGGATATPGGATQVPASQAPASAAATAAATEAPPNPHVPGADLGERVIGPDEPIHIAMWGVLTGSDAALGIDVQRGVELAVADTPELLGHEVQLTSEDAECKPEGGNTVATRLASDTTLVGLIGSVCSDETVGGIAAITAAGLTTISPSNTRPALTAPGRDDTYDGYLRTAHNDLFQGAAAAQFVFEVLGLTKAATIHDNSSYAQALQGVFADEFRELGGTITLQTAVGADDTDMSSVLTNVASTSPEIIYYPVFTAPFGFITAQSKQIPGLEDVELMAADGAFSAAAIEAGGENALGAYLSSPDTRQFPGGYPAFLEKYVAEYGTNPEQIFHAHAYDATNMLFAAIEEVAEVGTDGTLTISLGALRDAIYATENFPGLTGSLTCGDFGDCGAPAIGVYEITQAIVDDPQGGWPPAAIWPEL
jgi:branched-chain amino acid transport system substrate-binding protein